MLTRQDIWHVSGRTIVRGQTAQTVQICVVQVTRDALLGIIRIVIRVENVTDRIGASRQPVPQLISIRLSSAFRCFGGLWSLHGVFPTAIKGVFAESVPVPDDLR